MDKREQLLLQLNLIFEQSQHGSQNRLQSDSFRRLNTIPALCRRLGDWHGYHVLQLSEPANRKSCLALVAPIWLSLLRLAIEAPIGRNVREAGFLIEAWQGGIEAAHDPMLESGALIELLLKATQAQPCDIRSLFVAFFRLQAGLKISDDQLFRQTIQLLELGASFRIESAGAVYA